MQIFKESLKNHAGRLLTCTMLGAVMLLTVGCVFEPVPPPYYAAPPPSGVVMAPAPSYAAPAPSGAVIAPSPYYAPPAYATPYAVPCCYAYPEYPSYYGYGAPAVGLGFAYGGRGGRWR